MTAPVCRAPFVAMEFDPAGDVFTCCANQLFPMGNVGDSSLRDIWHGARARALRAALSDGDLSFGCNTCRWAIEHGHGQPFARLYDPFPVPSPAPPYPQRMTFALSNRCNLECITCNGELSSRLRARSGRPPLASAYPDRFFAELDEFLPHLRLATFLGGEPFLIAGNYRVWDRLAGLGVDTRCAVVTNGTRLDARVEAVLSSLPFDVAVSLDGVSTGTVEAVRKGIDHATVLAHARSLRDYATRRGTAFGFNFCLSRHNWFELGEFLAFADGWDADVTVISVSDEGHSLHDLPPADLAEVLRRLEAESPVREAGLGRNRARWTTEVAQVRRALARARQGTEVTIRQPERADGALVELPPRGVIAPPGARDAAGARMSRWAHGEPVARLVLDGDARVRRVEVDGEDVLGLGALAGRSIDGALRALDLATGRRFHRMDHTRRDGVVDQTFVVVPGAAVRGSSGSIVRVIAVRGPEGVICHVAADPFYERRPAVPVAVRR